MNATDSTESPTKITASILIPVYQDITGLETTLNALAKVGIPRPDAEVIVCNDAGGEAISRLATRYGVREVRLDKNCGSYAARNRGIDAAQGDILVFLDADQRVDEHWLDAGLTALQNADYVGGHIVVNPVDTHNSWWVHFDCATAFQVTEQLRRMQFAPTANLFVRRKVFDHVGIFREELRSGGDREFGQRVHRAGFVQRFCERAITYHPARNRAEQFKKSRRIARGHADITYFIEQKNPWLMLVLEIIILGKMPLETLWKLIRFGCSPRQCSVILQPIFILMEIFKKSHFHYYVAMRLITLGIHRPKSVMSSRTN